MCLQGLNQTFNTASSLGRICGLYCESSQAASTCIPGAVTKVEHTTPTVLCISSDPPHICSHLKINGAIETSFGVQAPYCP